MHKKLISFIFLIILFKISTAQSVQDSTNLSDAWYSKINIKGYAQARYNGLFETNPNLGCEQCDVAWGGGNSSFSLRRIRIVVYGQVGKQVYFYIQPDFASSISSSTLNFGQIRDAYFDVGVDKNNEFRFRIGQSKIPFGFENMQSSQNRLSLDRSDAINSAFRNERDLGVFFYWAPAPVRKLFAELVKSGLKGSGDYGVFGLGVFNGQTLNRPDENNKLHSVIRLTYPFRVGSQIIEPGIQAYKGKYVVTESQISEGVGFLPGRNYTDERVAASFILYPKPFGIQAEYNIGLGPEYNKLTNSIEVKNLNGGYATFSWRQAISSQILIPYTKMQYYNGGKKHETDARSYHVKEIELGLEWQPVKNFELVANYTFSSRRFEDHEAPANLQRGSLMRFQAQVNF